MNIVLLSALGLLPYRTVKLVEPNLKTSVFESCTSMKDGLYTVRFSIRADGKSSLLAGEPCFSAIESIAFPQSPNLNETFTWDVILQDGVLFPQLLRKESKKKIFPGIFTTDKVFLKEASEKHD